MSEPLSSNPPAAEWLEMLLSHLWEQRGTDLHLTAGSPPLARVDSQLHSLPNQPVLTPADTEAIAGSLLDDADRATFEQRGDGDFAWGFGSPLGQHSDALRVGEMRDLKSTDTVRTLAEPGHLVIATLNTNARPQAVDRLVGVFPGDQQNQVRLQLSAALVGVIYQRL